MRKLWYIYTVEYYSAIKKNAFESVLRRWIKLEPIIQSEVSQKEKHQYSILTHIYGIKKDEMCARQQKRHRCIEQSFGLCGRRRRWDDLRIALKHVFYHMWNRSPVQVRCMRQGAQGWSLGWPWGMGCGGRWEVGSEWGTHVHTWLIHVNVWQNPQYYNIINLQLK